MNEAWLVSFFAYLEPLLCATALVFLFRAPASRSFRSLTALLSVKLASSLICVSLIKLSVIAFIDVRFAYRVYFYVYWGSYALEAVLSLVVVYSIFKLSMAPLKGLQTLGMLIFRWVAAISVAVSIGAAIVPNRSGLEFIIGLVTQIQQTSSILTLCLLLFVCFAIRPMGLSYRSQIFGISVGLGILATTDLARAAWLSHYSTNIYSALNLISGLAMCATLVVWTAYFAFPEPKRRLIVLPTTSPFLRWNQISMALGDDPGYVAVGGIAPELFAPAEIEIMKRASAMMPAKKLDAPSNLRSMSA